MATVKCSKCAFLNESGAVRCRRCGTALASISFEAASKTPPRAADAPPQETFQFKRGQVVNNRYTVLDMIGRGGMGCIYKVHDNVLGEDLALKTLLPQFISEKTVIDRFLNEARITRKLTHPNIVRVHDIGTAGKGIFISMEYVQGNSLRALLEKHRPGDRMPVRQVLHIIDQLCVALDYAHQYTVHRDIKPENIMVTEKNQIKLMDFGISKLMDNRNMTSASIVMGTPFYMPPEQHRNTRDVDARADIYSVGVVMYEMLTGNIPTGVPKPASQVLKGIPPALDEIVAKCIEPDREKRFKSAGELRKAILPLIEMLAEGKDPQRTLAVRRLPRTDSRPWSGRRILLAATAVFVIAASAVSLYAVEQMKTPSAQPHALSDPANAAGGDRFAAVESMMRPLRTGLEAADELDQRQHRWLDRGRELWAQAEAASRQGEPAAIGLAENALQHFIAAAMNPQGMVFVPAGTVEVDGVSLFEPGFFIDTTEVTMSQFAAFCRQVEGGWQPAQELHEVMDLYPEYPVSYVAWFDAQAYAAWRGRQLPSRSQWERAAHGASQASPSYPWGEDTDPATFQTGYSRAVGTVNVDLVWSGCYDMAGNVSEWTSSPVNQDGNGTSPYFGDLIYVCGGSFLQMQPLNTPGKQYFETRLPELGFRCVLPVPMTREAVLAAIQRLP